MSLFIGLMSGTSMDGIDAALVDVKTNTLICCITRPYSEYTQHLLRTVMESQHSKLADFGQLNTLIGREFGLAALQLLKQANVSSHQVEAIGSHGQTIAHDPTGAIPYTLQIGCGHTIAELTAIPVVGDFRTRDVVLGGQGAPFAPIYHQALLRKLPPGLAMVNIGGIANITYLDEEGRAYGYDCGPGNCLMDGWIKRHLGQNFDENGAWAFSGSVIEPLLQTLLSDPYFKLPPPKSIGKEYFSENWLMEQLPLHAKSNDVQATLLALTATSISHAINHCNIKPTGLAICGGGAHNKALLRLLKKKLPGLTIQSTSAYGLDPDFLEAMMFAWLAEKTVTKTPLNLQLITGAKTPAVLGVTFGYLEHEYSQSPIP